jgi:hypothetical protein
MGIGTSCSTFELRMQDAIWSREINRVLTLFIKKPENLNPNMVPKGISLLRNPQVLKP